MKLACRISPKLLIKLCISFALILQTMMPSYAAAFGSHSQFNAASYFCNELQSEPEDSAKAALREVLTLAGKLEPAPDQNNHAHCDNCVMSGHVLATPNLGLANPIAYQSIAAQFAALTGTIVYPAQGPPIGGRAPPVKL